MKTDKTAYVPGRCNIGPAETQQRIRAGWIGLGLTFLVWALFIFFHVSAPWRLSLFLPASLAATGFIQAAFHFCANFGMRGVFNFGKQIGRVETVTQAQFRRRDRIKAQQIIFLSALLGVAAALLGYYVGPY